MPPYAENEQVRITVELVAPMRRLGGSGRFSLASSPPAVTWALRLPWWIGLTALAVYVTAAAGGPGDPPSIDYDLLYRRCS